MRTLIVDDEPLARAALVTLCREHGELGEVSTAGSGAEAIRQIRTARPNLILLDVELRDMTGFAVLEAFDEKDRPPVIMVTAHATYAVHAFDANVIDYLTKPVSAQRFDAAIDRAGARREAGTVSALCDEVVAAVRGMVGSNRALTGQTRRLVGEKARRLYFLPIDDVEYIESDGNYVTIHVGEQKYVSRDSLKRLATELQNEGFERIRRSTLVNLRRITCAERLGQATMAFTLSSGARLVSRTGYGTSLKSRLLRLGRERPCSET